MSVIAKLASSLNRRDEEPNQELAKQIVAKKDIKAVQELVANLSNKNKDIQNNCIKVLYEIGAQSPVMIAVYVKEFVALLDSSNNRLQWGAMTTLGTITLENPKAIYGVLIKITEAADKGSVITKDRCVGILIKLCTVKEYSSQAFSLFIEQLLKSPTNQLPMYAEMAVSIIDEKNKAVFVKALSSRLSDIEKDTKRKRVEKVIQKFSKK